VLARYFGISLPFDTTEGKKFFAELAQELLEKNSPGIYNQAIMDFGAVVCKPISPDCSQCPLRKQCFAATHNQTASLPVKAKTITRKNRWFTYLLITGSQGTLVRQRMDKDIWQHLFEFVLIESKEAFEWNTDEMTQWVKEKLKITITGMIKSSLLTQQLTHQTVNVQFITAIAKKQMAFPRIIRQYLDNVAARQARMF
jgi:A/G-specific adenine glycosylase